MGVFVEYTELCVFKPIKIPLYSAANSSVRCVELHKITITAPFNHVKQKCKI